MNAKLTEMLKASSFAIDPEEYMFVTVTSIPSPGTYRMLFQDATEITVVCLVSRLNSLDVLEKNPNIYRLIRVSPSTPFYAVGFTGAITSAIGQAGANVVVLGTYSFDYMAVRQEQLELAVNALKQAGLKENKFTSIQES